MASSSSSGTGAGGLRRPGAMRGKLKAPKRLGLDVSPEDMWKRLAHAIEQIQNHNVSTLSYEEHYRYAYNLVLFHQGQMLYEGVQKKVADHLNKQCTDILVPAFPPGGTTSFHLGTEIVLPRVTLPPAPLTSTSKGKQKAHDTNVPAAPPQEPTPPTHTLPASDDTDAASRSQHAEGLLKALKIVWDDHCACMGKLRDVLKYVDRVFVVQNNVLPVWELGLQLFRDTVIHSTKHPIAQHLYYALLSQIQLERKGQVINRSAVKANIDMLTALTWAKPNTALAAQPTLYKHLFEPAFITTSANFYSAEAHRLLETTDAKTYLRHVERRLVEEEGRVAVLLNPTTDTQLQAVLEQHLLASHLRVILDMPASGLTHMLDDTLKDDLERLYKLFWRVQVEGPVQLKAALKAYISKKGKDINDAVAPPAAEGEDASASSTAPAASAAAVSSPQLALKWVEDVLTFKNKFDDILATSFHGDKSLETVLNEAFESFINTNTRAPEFISLFIDENLKKGLKGKTEKEVEDTLDRTIVVFRFLHEKDVFERYYKGHLAKRLLQNRSVSDDAERGMMAKLKVECGHGYVTKLSGMLNDMKLSEETANAFSNELRRSDRHMPFDLSVSVLTSTYWPIPAQVQPCTMPPTMASAREKFETFYKQRHSGRVLNWHPNLGTADVRVAFRNRKHELNVSTYALVVLMLFEDEESTTPISYETMRTATNIPDADLKRTLQSLACAKYKILLKEPKGRDVNASDTFTFNVNFTCPLARIKIAQVAASRVESTVERKETNARIEEDRRLAVEASIVRIMKNRKTSTHNDLVNEVVKQLLGRFNPSPALVKQRIESLIDRDYLERSEEGRNVYNYLA